MLRKMMMATVAIVGMTGLAMAQTAPSTGTGTSAGGSTVHGATSGATTSGLMTETQVKQKLQQLGYSDVQLKPHGATGSGSTAGSSTSSSGSSGSSTMAGGNQSWTGTAMKGGKKVNIEVDGTGKVTEK